MTDIRLPVSPRFVLGDAEDRLAITRPIYGPERDGKRAIVGQAFRVSCDLDELLERLEGRMTAEDVARIAHEANRAYCLAMGDASQLPWAETELWQRDSALRGVDAVIADPTITPEQLHESWTAAKVADGWTFGRVKDPVAKTHPCLVPYRDLPLVQRTKDYLFGGVVRACLGYA